MRDKTISKSYPRLAQAIERIEAVKNGLNHCCDRWVRATNIRLKKRAGKVLATIIFTETTNNGSLITERIPEVEYDHEKLLAGIKEGTL